jgi:hypothetical protein
MTRGSTGVAEHAARVLVAVALLVSEAPALAVEASGVGEAAEELFQQGRRAMEAGDVARGCRLLEQSLAREDATGTLLNLALCHEKLGKLATASVEFRRVEERALAQAPPDPGRASFAQQHGEALKPKVAWLAFTLPSGATEPAGVEVRVDDRTIPRASWDAGTPLEPGDHPVRISGPGKAPFTTTVTIPATPGRTLVLLDTGAFVGGAGDRGSSRPGASMRSTLGWTAMGAGAGLVVTSAVLGIAAAASGSDATCPAPCVSTVAGEGTARVRNPDLVRAEGAYDRASVLATLSTGTALVGLAGLAVGAYLLFFPDGGAGRNPSAGARVGVGFGPTGVVGRF